MAGEVVRDFSIEIFCLKVWQTVLALAIELPLQYRKQFQTIIYCSEIFQQTGHPNLHLNKHPFYLLSDINWIDHAYYKSSMYLIIETKFKVNKQSIYQYMSQISHTYCEYLNVTLSEFFSVTPKNSRNLILFIFDIKVMMEYLYHVCMHCKQHSLQRKTR